MWTKKKEKSIATYIRQREGRQYEHNRIKEILREEDNQAEVMVRRKKTDVDSHRNPQGI